MKKPYICWIILVISVLANIYLFTRNASLITNIQNLNAELDTCEAATCDFGSFGEKKEMSLTELVSYKDQFVKVRTTEEHITGGVISAASIYEMLCLENCNAIAYTFGRDTIPDKGPDKRGVFIMLKGVNVVYDEANDKVTEVKDVGSRIYYGGYWCPTACLPMD